MKKSKLLLIVSLVLALTMSLGGTLAYLTDTDSEVNVMALGNVKIEQHEYQRAEGVAHNAGEAGKGNGIKKGELVPFVKGQALYPAFPAEEGAYTAEATDLFYWGDYVYSGTACNGLWNDSKLKGAMDKFVFVENTGSSPAYFRTWFAFECPQGMEYSQGSDKEFMVNVNIGETMYSWDDLGYTTIEGVRYLVKCATYQMALEAGNTSHPSLLQVVMTHNATNEDMALLGNTYEILALTQAVQTNNFEDAEQALNAAFGEATLANQPWKGDVAGLPADYAGNLDDLLGKLGDLEDTTIYVPTTDGDLVLETEDDIEFDGNGNTVVLNGDVSDPDPNNYKYGYIGFVPTPGKDVTVSDLTVTGKGFVELGHYNLGGGNYEANNLVVKDLAATLKSGDGTNVVGVAFSHYGNAVLNNCVMTGTTALREGTTPYDAGFVHDTTTTIKGGEYGRIYLWNRAVVTINNAEIGQIDSTLFTEHRTGGNLIIGAGTHVGTVNLICGSNRTPKLVIEDGAVIDQIVFNGVTYTQAEWLAH